MRASKQFLAIELSKRLHDRPFAGAQTDGDVLRNYLGLLAVDIERALDGFFGAVVHLVASLSTRAICLSAVIA